MGATRPASVFQQPRPAFSNLVYEHCIFPDARRVAPIRAQIPGITILPMASNLLFTL